MSQSKDMGPNYHEGHNGATDLCVDRDLSQKHWHSDIDTGMIVRILLSHLGFVH